MGRDSLIEAQNVYQTLLISSLHFIAFYQKNYLPSGQYTILNFESRDH